MGHDVRARYARRAGARLVRARAQHFPRDTTQFSGIFPEIPEWLVRMATKKLSKLWVRLVSVILVATTFRENNDNLVVLILNPLCSFCEECSAT